MMVPIRCFSCGKVVSEHYGAYKDMVSKGKSPKETMDSLGIERYCCRRIFMTSKEFIEDLNKYQK